MRNISDPLNCGRLIGPVARARHWKEVCVRNNTMLISSRLLFGRITPIWTAHFRYLNSDSRVLMLQIYAIGTLIRNTIHETHYLFISKKNSTIESTKLICGLFSVKQNRITLLLNVIFDSNHRFQSINYLKIEVRNNSERTRWISTDIVEHLRN